MPRILGVLGVTFVLTLPLASQKADIPRANPALPAVPISPAVRSRMPVR